MQQSGVPEGQSLDLARLSERIRTGTLTATALVEEVIARLDAAGDDKIWITRCSDDGLRSRAAALDRSLRDDPGALASLPLFGIPFAAKDNIDVAGLPTTAGCPGFAYQPSVTAPAVEKLLAAGAVLVGKTNLDQFATGLVGTRSPYGVPRNPFDPRYIPGGSSSGSAVAVAQGLVSFALGTDTAGSGRIPAAFTNTVGLKPTIGLVSTRGVVPACRTLDCVSVFALTVEDAARVLAVCAAYDERDPFARHATQPRPIDQRFRFAVPRVDDREFFGDADAARLFERALAALEALGGTCIEIDFAPFRAAAELLYGGPWVAERYVTVEPLLRRAPEALMTVTREIIAGAVKYAASDAFKAFYRLAELRRQAEALWQEADVLVVPTAGTIYSVADIEAEPIRLNTNLGLYTNFANLLDLAAIALPAGFRGDGLPFGISLVGPAFSDAPLAALADRVQRHFGLPLGATRHALPPPRPAPEIAAASTVHLAVAGAHMRGMALNSRLIELGARFVAATRTAAVYRLFLLGGEPPRPGLVRVPDGGHAIEVEIWSIARQNIGTIVAEAPAPLTIGTVLLEDGQSVKGFLAEGCAGIGAEDITDFGGWRNFLAARTA